ANCAINERMGGCLRRFRLSLPENHSPGGLPDGPVACQLAIPRGFRDNAAHSARELNGSPVGPPATTSCEPRQVRKEAAVAVTSCAGVWLAGLSPFLPRQACFPAPFLVA